MTFHFKIYQSKPLASSTIRAWCGLSAHYLNMGGDYILTWDTGRGYRQWTVTALCPQSPKSVICTLHLSPGCHGQWEEVQSSKRTSHCLISDTPHIQIYYKLAHNNSQKRALIPCYPSALSSPTYLPHPFFYGCSDCVAFTAQQSLHDDSQPKEI